MVAPTAPPGREPSSDTAEDIARTALIWLAGDPERMGVFLATSGVDPAEIRARARDPEFLGFVLDFVLASEPLLMEFCGDCGLRAEAPAAARARLPGGTAPNWT